MSFLKDNLFILFSFIKFFKVQCSTSSYFYIYWRLIFLRIFCCKSILFCYSFIISYYFWISILSLLPFKKCLKFLILIERCSTFWLNPWLDLLENEYFLLCYIKFLADIYLLFGFLILYFHIVRKYIKLILIFNLDI